MCKSIVVVLSVLVWIGASVVMAGAQAGDVKKLGVLDEVPPIDILLCRTPKLGFFLASGDGIVVAQVRVRPTGTPGEVQAKIAGFFRLWRDDRKGYWARRDSPQITRVPFKDENYVQWACNDGNRWRLGEEFVIEKTDLVQRAEKVPAYRGDKRAFWQSMGTTRAGDAAETILKLVD